jgi:DNA-binding MarR family transcriptional regulator
MNLKKFPVSIAVALLLLLVDVVNVGPSAVLNAISTAEVQIIHHLQVAEVPCVERIRIICKWPMDELFLSAEIAMASSSASTAGLWQEKYFCFLLLRMMEKKMHDKILTDLEKKVLIGKKLGVFDDFAGQQLLKCFSYGIQDKFIVGQIEKRVGHAQRRIALSGCPFLPPKLHHGQIKVGHCVYGGKEIFIPIQYLNAGTIEVANTGSGKSTRKKYFAIQIAPHVRGTWLIDLRKKDWRDILYLLDIDISIIRDRKYKRNPMQLEPGVSPHDKASLIGDILVRVLNLPPRAAVLISTTTTKLYKEFGVFNGSENCPTFYNLFENIRNNREANAQARQAVLDNLEALLIGLGPEVLAYYKGWSTTDLAQKHLVFEWPGLTETGKDLLLNDLVGSEFIARLARHVSNQPMDLWVSIDEGQRLFSQRNESSSREGNAITDLAGLTRGAGIGMDISVLTPDDLSSKIPSITSTRIIGRCGSVTDYMAAGRFCGLNQEQVSFMAHNMVPGIFVGQVSEGNWRYPFLFRVPPINKEYIQAVTNEEADESLKSLASLKVVPAPEFSNWSAMPSITINDLPQPKATSSDSLTSAEIKLLEAIVRHPIQASSKYAELAGISPNTFKKVRPILKNKGLISEHKLQANTRGRSTILLGPTEEGKKYLSDYGCNKTEQLNAR